MVKKADIGGKKLISLAPESWVKWVTQRSDLVVEELLSSEFQWISRENDVLLKVITQEGEEFLILNELQLRYKEEMPWRIRAYTALAEEKYKLPVYPVLINILPNSPNENIPNYYQTEFMGIKAYQSYHVINLWEVEADLVFQENISSLLPFVPILKGGAEEKVVKQALSQLRKEDKLEDLEPLLSFFASFVLEIPIIQQIMRWDMVVLKESPWYQQILQEGLQRGEEQGLQKGELILVMRLLSKRFKNIDRATILQVQQLEIPQLESLAESLFDFREINDLYDWMQQNS